jgi:poly(3-hydroxybutyrate) depolymerase
MRRSSAFLAVFLAASFASFAAACSSSGANDASTPSVQDAAAEDGNSADANTADATEASEANTDASASRCNITAQMVTCKYETSSVADSQGTRTVVFATPLGASPASGFPAVVYFQGSFVPGHDVFSANATDAFDAYALTLTVSALLDHGYAVIAPDTSGNGSEFWETNIPPYATSWSGSPDDVLMQNLFGAISSGKFGSIDASHLYAMGISSGGFMTSRMAVSYAGKFRALADVAGSYATCSDTCTVPTPLPSDHPPTIFLHGDEDDLVPASAVQPYFDALQTEGHDVKLVTDADAGHQWLDEGVVEIPAWFAAHP